MLVDVTVGVMDEYAGVYVTGCIDVQVVTASGYAAMYELGIVLKIHGEDGFCFTILSDPAVNSLTLIRVRHQLGNSIVSNGHIMEEPCEQSAVLDHHIEELLAGDILIVCAGVAGGNTKGQLVIFQKLHGMFYFAIYTLTAAAVVGGLKAFQADSRNEVLHAKQLFTERFVDQSTIGEGKELTVRMTLTESNQIFFANQGFSASVDVHVDTELFTLFYYVIDGVQIQVQFVTVLSSPAAGTVQITGRSRVEKDSPGNVAVLFCHDILMDRGTL